MSSIKKFAQLTEKGMEKAKGQVLQSRLSLDRMSALHKKIGPDLPCETFHFLKEKEVNELRGNGMLEQAQILFGKRRGNHYYQLI